MNSPRIQAILIWIDALTANLDSENDRISLLEQELVKLPDLTEEERVMAIEGVRRRDLFDAQKNIQTH